MPVFYGPSIDIDLLRGMHDYLIQRGWQLDRFSDRLDEDDYPGDPESAWEYALSYHGEIAYEIDDVTPDRLKCRFDFDDSSPGVTVEQAGNWNGCTNHDATEHHVSGGDDLFNRLTELLDTLEQPARELDLRELIECRFFGLCGETYSSL